MSELLEGVQLSDFLLMECISRGGVADVYRGRPAGGVGSGVYDVAVKVFRPGYAQRALFREYFMAEAEKIGQFEHPNILPFLEFGEGESLLYAVTPLIEGGTLDDLLNRVGGKFSAMQALPIMQQLCSAVQYAHDRNVIHGNIKPSNVFVGTDGRMLLADFGIVRGYDDSQQSLTRIGWGSAEYAAPEQSLGVLRRASDIYSLGALLFRILTGQPPFTGQTPVEVLLKHVRLPVPSARSVDVGISDAVDDVLQRSLRKRSDDRYASAVELSDALLAAVTIAPVASPVARAVPAITRQLPPDPFDEDMSSMPTGPIAGPPPATSFDTPDPFVHDPGAPFKRSGLFELPFQQMSPAAEPAYQEGTGAGGALAGGSGVIERKHFLQDDDDDAGTHLFWSVEPPQWSPITNEQVGSVPLTAADYLRSMPDSPQVQPARPVKPAIPAELVVPAVIGETGDAAVEERQRSKSGALSEPGQARKEPEERQETRKKRRNILPILVVILLLLGLLAALLSSFLFPGPSGSPSLHPGGTTTQARAASLTPSPVRTLTPGASTSPGAATGTVTAATTATAAPQPSLSPTPVPIPANPAVPSFACSSGALSMDGSASFMPVITQLTSDYSSQCNNGVNFTFNPDGSQVGLNDLANGSIDLAYSDLPSSGRAGLVDYQVAALIFVVVVNSDVQVTNLSAAQLRSIYTGSITNWSQVGGADEPINVLTQPVGSTLRTIFEKYVLGGIAQTVPGVTAQDDVQSIPGGITYMPLAEAAASESSAQPISINNVSPTIWAVESGAYPFWTIEHLYTDHAAQGVALSFISFCFSAFSVNDFAENGAVPYPNMSSAALSSHLPSPTI